MRLMAGALVATAALVVTPLVTTTTAATASVGAGDGVVAYGVGGTITMQDADGTDAHTIASYDFDSEQLQGLDLSADGSLLAYEVGYDGVGGWTEGAVRVVDTATGAVVREIVDDGDDSAYLVDIAPDGTSVAIQTQTDVRLVSVATGAASVLPGLGFPASVQPAGFTPDGASLIVTDSDDQSMGSYDVASGTITPLAFTPPEASASASTVSYDGTINYMSSAGECDAPLSSRIVGVDGSGDAPFATTRTDHRAIFSPDGDDVLFVRADEPLTARCAGDAMEQPVDVLLADRAGSSPTPAFTAVAWDWAGIVQEQQVDRIAGASRYSTALELSQSAFPDGADAVFIVSGETFADALAAGPAATAAGGPVLLTPSTRMPASIIDEIERLGAARVVLVGGESAISAAAEQALRDGLADAGVTADIERIAGTSRYQTSALLAADAFDAVGSAYLASGASFPDGLAAGAAAGTQGQPLLLVNGAGSLSQSVVDAIESLDITEIVIAGGEASVRPEIETQLEALGVDVDRAAGSSRYTTAVQVNQVFQDADHVLVASGASFPDALAGAAVAGARGEPLYLTNPRCVPQSVLTDLERLGSPSITILGGASSVSAGVAQLTGC